jgi:osmotically inducible protein OsmC
MTFSRHATISWQGGIMDGTGAAKAGSGAFDLPVTFPRRIGEPEGSTSPEELIAAAHGTCYAMVVAATLGRKSASAKSTSVTCTVTAEKTDAGLKIKTSKLEIVAEGLSGIDADAFVELAKSAEGGCPVSNALRNNVAIEVVASVK